MENFSTTIGSIVLEQIENLSPDDSSQPAEIGSERWIMLKANEIYTELGKGYQECVYHRAFEYELKKAGIDFESEITIPVMYKSVQVGTCKADIVIRSHTPMILEFKAIGGNIGIKELEQLGHYIRNMNIKTGVVINFSQPSLVPKNSVDFIFGRMSD